METKKYRIYWDRIFVLSFLIGIEYALWLSSQGTIFINAFLISYVAVCCFIVLFKNPLFIKLKSEEVKQDA